ncbi:MAG: TonB-dependent siderophore receptor [Verrucomicrobiales bacterium]|nr:TonB-dependent siderophore receptor [Verrucomicrobiales bacterium]
MRAKAHPSQTTVIFQKIRKAIFFLTMVASSVAHAQEQLEETVITTERPAPVVNSTPNPQPAPVPEPIVIEPETIDEPLIISDVNVLRTGTPILDLPRSVSVFSEQRIEDQGIRNIGEIVDYTPGVNTSQGEGHRDSIVFRGQPRSTADFFIDGVRDDVQYYRGLYNIEQVEILRGPSALVFGRGGTGGILNRVTKKPVIGGNFTNYDITVDTFGGNLTQFDWNQTLGDTSTESIGKGGKHLVEEPVSAFRLNGFYEYLNNHRDFYDGNRVGVNPTLALQIAPDTRLDLSYEYNNHERFIDRGIPTGANGLPVTALAGIVFGDPEQNFSEFESHAIRASLSHDFSDTWKGRLTAFYGDYEKTYQNFYASGYNQATDQVTIDGYIDNTFRENFVLSGDLVGEFETGFIEHKVLIGGEYSNTSSDQNRFNSFWDTTMADTEVFNASNFRLQNGAAINSAGNLATNNFNVDLNDDTRVNIDTYSIFLQDEIALSDHLDLVLGARFDSFDIEVFNAVNGQTRTRRDEEISPRLGLIIKPVESVSIYGSFSESFLPRSGEQFANINGNNNALDPDTFTNMEVGVKWDIQPDFSFRTAVFEIEQSSPQVADNDPATFDVIDTVTSGFEAELVGNLTDRWFISTGYTYLDADQVNRTGPNGLRPREVPKHSFSVWNQYAVTERLGFALGVIFQDDSFADNGNTAVLPDYTRVDAAAFYRLSERYRLQVNIENLFDTEYFPNSHSTHQVTVGRPINAAVSIRGTF